MVVEYEWNIYQQMGVYNAYTPVPTAVYSKVQIYTAYMYIHMYTYVLVQVTGYIQVVTVFTRIKSNSWQNE